jgi:hypothetical protein
MNSGRFDRRVRRLEAARPRRKTIPELDIGAELKRDDPERLADFIEAVVRSGLFPDHPPECAATHREPPRCLDCAAWHETAEQMAAQRDPLFILLAEPFGWPLSAAARASLRAARTDS